MMCCVYKGKHKGISGTCFTLFGTFAYAANEMSGNILVMYPPGGQMENYISGRSFTVSKNQSTFHITTHGFLSLQVFIFCL